jgi:hypothetical protein
VVNIDGGPEEDLWPRLSLTGIGVATAVGLAISLMLDISASNAELIAPLLAGVEITSMLLVRLVVLPQAARGTPESRHSVPVVGYAFTMSPAVVGVVAAVFTGQWYVPLIFAAIALVAWVWIHSFVSELPPLKESGDEVLDLS